MPNPIIFYYDDEDSQPILFCESCAILQHRCDLCAFGAGTNCAFASYEGPLDKYIMIQQTQGPMTVQRQIENPEVVKQTCGNCQCYHDSICCRAPGGWCQNQKRKEELNNGCAHVPKVQDTE